MAAGERWYFTKEQLLQTPSRKCGIDADKELSYRQQAANFIQDMGQRLQVTQLCINTAIVYMHRFYMFHSFLKFHRNAIATCALFLAAKVEEQPRKLEHVIKVANVCLNRDGPPLDTKSEAYLEQAQELVFNENIMLQTLGFDVAIDHPHTHVVKCCQLVRDMKNSMGGHPGGRIDNSCPGAIASKDLAQTSYFMATNSLHLTTMCMQYCPTVVACVCIHLACKWASWEIPCSSEGKEWFWYVDKTVTLELLEELTAEFLAILDKCPSRLKKKIMSAGKDVVSPPEKKSKLESTSSSNSSTSVVPSSNYEKSRSPFKAGDKLDRYEVITERFERAERAAEKAEMDKRERLERMQRHEKLETKKDNFDKKMEFKSNLSDKAEWSNLSNKIDRIPEKREVQLEVHNTSNVSQQQLHRIPSPTNQHHSSYKLSGKKRSDGTKSLTPKEYRELRERREKERHSSANSSHASSRQKTPPQHTNKSSRPYSPDKARTRREESAPSLSDFNHSCNSVDQPHVTDPSLTQISHVDVLQQISRAPDKAALLSHCTSSPPHYQNDVHSVAPPPPPPPPPLKVDTKLDEQKISSQSEKNRGNQDSLAVHQKTVKHEPLSPTIKKVVSSASEKQQDIKAVDSMQMQTVESSQTLTHIALKISPSPTEPQPIVSAEKLPEKLPQPPSEKHDRKERHKHKERDKERPRDKVDNSSTDFREPLSSPPAGSSSTPTSQRILLTIPKERLNHSGTGYQDTSSPQGKGIKLKISKEMLTSTPKTGSVSGDDKLKVKIKIPKDTKNRYNSGSEGDRRKSESRKRDRDRSPKDSNSRNDYPRSPKHPRKESRSGRKEESLNSGPPSLLQLPMPPEPGQAVSRHNSWVKH